jgi:Methyltransferase domain/C-methyltransferase C-terminal domain
MPPGSPESTPAWRCPACGSDRLVRMLDVRGVPIHTSTLLDSHAKAIAYPRADLRLDVCRACGLLTNTAFDAAAHDYSASYEEVQSFSPRFRAYASELARTLVDRHSLRGRDVFEIGCGRADFLLEICARTGAAGYAVDPSFREDRLQGPAADRIVVERAFFVPDLLPAGVAAVICRHTLEHVQDVAGFLRAVRLGLERAPDAVVVFEVPDTWRVLRETAFWDLFYEHCSYFTAGSLARAFRTAGLGPDRLDRTFDDQYLVLTAHAARPGEGKALPLEESPADVVELAATFADGVDRAREKWGTLLGVARERGEKTVIWGAGSKGVGFLTALGLADEVAYAVDVNPAKHRMFMPGTGHEIVAPERLTEIRPGIVIVMNPAYTEEISGDLRRLGVDARVLSL